MVAPGYELVRVSRELVEALINSESNPVVVMSIERHDDGTCELLLRSVDLNGRGEGPW